jgi:polyhydroxybutyrate depolymerase
MRTRAIVRALVVVAALSGALWFWARRPRAKFAGAPTNALVAARPYRLLAPTTLDPRKTYPLVLVLHGFGGTSERIERYYQLDPLVEERGFLVAYPDGTEETQRRHFWGGHRRFWNDACCDVYLPSVDDVAYLDAIIDDVSAHYRVDGKRVFVMGISNGGSMSYRYACDRASRVAAILSRAGAMWADTTHCKPSEPVAVLQIHGTDDKVVSYDVSAHQSARDWVAFDHCDATPDASAPPRDLVAGGFRDDVPDAETTTERWTGCRGVELWTMRGAGHAPGPASQLGGEPSTTGSPPIPSPERRCFISARHSGRWFCCQEPVRRQCGLRDCHPHRA